MFLVNCSDKSKSKTCVIFILLFFYLFRKDNTFYFISTGQLFSAMFPDSDIAKNFSCGQTKCAYICAYGLAPHFKGLLTNKLKSGDENYVLLFDESLNRMYVPYTSSYMIVLLVERNILKSLMHKMVFFHYHSAQQDG